MSFEQLPKRFDPLIGVLSGLTHPDRHIVSIAKRKIFLDGVLIHRHPVLMKSVGELSIKGRPKNFEIGVLLRAAQKDDVISIHLSYSRNDLSVERFQLWI